MCVLWGGKGVGAEIFHGNMIKCLVCLVYIVCVVCCVLCVMCVRCVVCGVCVCVLCVCARCVCCGCVGGGWEGLGLGFINTSAIRADAARHPWVCNGRISSDTQQSGDLQKVRKSLVDFYQSDKLRRVH